MYLHVALKRKIIITGVSGEIKVSLSGKTPSP
jgi:hypothetical protein